MPHKSSWPHFCVRQRRLREKRTWLNKKNSHPFVLYFRESVSAGI